MVKRRGKSRKNKFPKSWLPFLLIFLASFLLLSLVLVVILSAFPEKERVQYLLKNLGELGIPGLKSVGISGRQISAQAFPTIGSQNIPVVCPTATIYSVRDGNWNDASTWNLGRVPGDNDAVNISHKVTYNLQSNAGIQCVNVHGVLNFSRSVDTRLMVGYLLVFPEGVLEIGVPGNPIPDGRTAEIVIRDVPLDLTNDPDQFGTALIGLGKVNIHGVAMNPTFVRLSRAPRAGDTNFSLQDAVSGWKVGDKLILPDSNQYQSTSNDRYTYLQLEERIIQSISPDGRTITFSPALTYNHPGTTDENGDGQPDYLPHVVNLRRNVVVKSESKTGTRGHVLFTYRAAVDIRYAGFVDLGRTTFNDLNSVTNHIGRYSLHMHHHVGPLSGTPWFDSQYQFRLVGNAIYEDSSAVQPPPQKWGITIHHSHYGLIQDNIVYNLGGAGIVTEDGSESYNVFDHNFVAKISSNGGRLENEETTRGIAREGVGFWFRGSNNYVRNNVVANVGENAGSVESSYAYKYQQVLLGNVNIPNFRGADTSIVGEYTTRAGTSISIPEFTNNEGYGLVQGFTLWWLCGYRLTPGCGQSIIQNLTLWHVMRYSYYAYPAHNYVFDNVKVYGSTASFPSFYNAIWWYGDYYTTDHILRNSYFYNSFGVFTPGVRDGIVRFENNYFKTQMGLIHITSINPGSGCVSSCTCSGCTSGNCNLPDPNTILVNNRYAAPAGRALRTITLNFNYKGQDIANNEKLIVCNHNEVVGDNFEVFFSQKNNAPCTTTRADIGNEGPDYPPSSACGFAYVCQTALADATCANLSTSQEELVQPNDFVYQGAFKFPSVACAPEQPNSYCWDYGAASITYVPSGDPSGPNDGYPGSIFGSGHSGAPGRVSEIAIPVPSKTTTVRAATLQPFKNTTDNVDIQIGGGPSGTVLSNMGGLLYVPPQGVQSKGLLYWSYYVFYDTAPYDTDFPSFGFSELNLSLADDARGAWKLGPLPGYTPQAYEFHQKRTSRYMLNVPQDFAIQYLGGRSILAGKGNGPGLAGSSSGPPFIAFAPVSDTNPPAPNSSLPAQTLVMYNYDQSLNYPNFTQSDEFTSAVWIRAGGKNAVAVATRKGLNLSYCYGCPLPAAAGYSGCFEWCYDPCAGGSEKGPHNWPYQVEIALYDPQDFVSVIQGTKLRHEVFPYAKFVPPEFGSCSRTGGMAFDDQRGLLYIVDGQFSNQDVRVYRINATSTPAVCGNGVVELGEVCDGSNLNGQTCVSRGFSGGTLSCLSNCLGFNTSACTAQDSSLCAPLPAAAGTVITASPSDNLPSLVSSAASGTTILLQDGTYTLTSSLSFNNPRVSLRSASGNRGGVIIDANYGTSNGVGEIIRVYANNITIADLTIKRAWDHLIHVNGGESVLVYNVQLIDARTHFIKVNPGATDNNFGTVACSSMEMTDTGRTFLENNPVPGYLCYTGGLDAHQGVGWTVRDNLIKGIYCTNGGLAEHGIHLWNGGSNNLVERNILINNSRGIGFGLLGSGTSGGTIRNNFIYTNIPYYDSGIGIEDSPNSFVYHNTIYSTQGVFNVPIDIRGTLSDSSVVVRNNLHEPAISVRNGASPTMSNNVRANSSMFVNLGVGNLHLLSTASSAINSGMNVGVTQDIDREARDSQPDVGADEFVSGGGLPVLTITSPTAGQTITTSSVTVRYNESGNLAGVDHVHLQLDTQTEIRDLDNDGVYIFNNVADGPHSIGAYMASADHSQVGAAATVSFTVSTAGSCLTNDPALQLYMNFDDGTAADLSGRGNNGVVTGAIWNAAGGHSGGAFEFNGRGTNSYITLGSTITSGTSASYAFWARMKATNDWRAIMGINGANEILSRPGVNDLSIERGGALYLTTPITLNQWYHIVYTDDGVTSKLYVNGALNQTTAARTAVSVQYLGLGDFSYGDIWNGTIDDVLVFNRALTDSEVSQLYSGNYCPTGAVCGNGIISGTETCDDGNTLNGDGCSSTCQIETPSCSLTNALWSTSLVTEGQRATLTVDGNICDGQQVNFVVYEDDILGGEESTDDSVSVNPVSAIFSGGRANTSWIAEWQSDCFGLCNPPEYYFIASLQSDASITRRSNAPLLDVQRAVVPCTDIDGDGYGYGVGDTSSCPNTGADCNDNNRSIYPGALEVCNGADDDCDGLIDEGVTNTYYRDADGDLYGDTLSSTQSCTQPLGYVLNSLDCDDSNNNRTILRACNYNNVSCGSYSLCVESCFVPPPEICGSGVDEDCNGADALCSSQLPTLTVNRPLNITYKNKPVPLRFTASGASNCWYLLNGARTNTACITDTSLQLPSGSYLLQVAANNSAGQAQESRAFNVSITRRIRVRYSEFNSITETTPLDDLTDEQLENVSLVLDNAVDGKIEFLELVNLTAGADSNDLVDLDAAVNISFNRIEVLSEIIPSLNKRARITIKNLAFSDPRALRDSAVCTSCTEESYSHGIFVFQAPGFTVYSAEETPVIPSDGTPSGPGGGPGGPGGPATPPRNASQNRTSSQVEENETRFIPVENRSAGEEEIPQGEGGEERQVGEIIKKNLTAIVLALITTLVAVGIILWFVWWHHKHEVEKIAGEFREQFSNA